MAGVGLDFDRHRHGLLGAADRWGSHERLTGVDGGLVVGQVLRVGFEGAAGQPGGGGAAHPTGLVGLFSAVGPEGVDLAAFDLVEELASLLHGGELVEAFDVDQGSGMAGQNS